MRTYKKRCIKIKRDCRIKLSINLYTHRVKEKLAPVNKGKSDWPRNFQNFSGEYREKMWKNLSARKQKENFGGLADVEFPSCVHDFQLYRVLRSFNGQCLPRRGESQVPTPGGGFVPSASACDVREIFSPPPSCPLVHPRSFFLSRILSSYSRNSLAKLI